MSSGQRADTTSKLYQDIYTNMKMGTDSIINLLPSVKDSRMKAKMTEQLAAYEKYAASVKKELNAKGITAKEKSAMTKMAAKIGMKMNTMMDPTRGHLAEMMVQGSTMDITDLLQKVSANRENESCREAVRLAREIVSFEEKNVETMKGFL